MSKKRGRPRTLNREQVVNIAMETYWREEIFSVSVNEICRRAEISKPGLYREFGGEDGLMIEVLQSYEKHIIDSIIDLISAEKPFFDVMNQLLEALTHESSHPLGCLLVKMRFSSQRLGEGTRVKVIGPLKL